MPNRHRSGSARRLAFAAMVGAGAVSSDALAQLRIVSLNGTNTLNTNNGTTSTGPRNGTGPGQREWMEEILTAIGSSVSDDPTTAGNTGIAKPIDILCLQESAGHATTGQGYRNLLNSIYPGSNYQVVATNGGSNDPFLSTQTLVYNANAVSVIGTTTVGTVSTTGQPRQTLRHQIRPVGYTTSDFYIYNSHFKSGDGTTNKNRRTVEAQAIRNNADALPANSNIIYLGDLNLLTHSEGAWQTLTTAAGGGSNDADTAAYDPVNLVGVWNSDVQPQFIPVYTQSPFNSATATAQNTGFSGSGGGISDRFDWQLSTATVRDGNGFAYIPNSYQAFGNNGTQALGDPIDAPSNTAQPTHILEDMAAILDHLPVVADYQLPAKQGVSVASVPSHVITGGSVGVNVTVTNAAPISHVLGADPLDYSLTSSGAVSGAATATSAPMAAGNVHSVTLNTTGTGFKTGSISVNSSNESVANGSFNQNVNFTVLDHANGSLSPSADVTEQSIDFGYVPLGSATRTAAFAISNRTGTDRAGLALTSIDNAGDTARLSNNATTFAHLAAGSTNSYNESLNASVAGDFSATRTFNVSDENLPGATPRPDLVVTSTARVFSVATFPVTGYMFLPANEPLTTGSFAIGAGVTLSKTGPGNMTINGPHNNGAGSQLVLNGGTTTFNSSSGPTAATLALTVNSGASAVFNAGQNLASLTIADGANVSVPEGSPSAYDPGNNLFPTGNNALASKVAALSITGSGRLDLGNSDLVIDHDGVSPLDAVRDLLVSGFNGGGWDGPGIISSGAVNTDPSVFALGYAENADLPTPYGTAQGGPLFNTFEVDDTALLVKFTYVGDLNLDGLLDFGDLSVFNTNWDNGASSGRYWFEGDFNYDGFIDFSDLSLFNTNYDPSKPSLPEPGIIGAVFGLGLLAGRRRARVR